jgi:FkbM family methyltransferase
MDVGDDPYWIAAAAFVRASGCSPGAVVAPAEFEALVAGIVSYEWRERCAAPGLVVLHKSRLRDLGARWIEHATATLHPVFGNPVFVIFSATAPTTVEGEASDFLAFKQALDELREPVGGARGGAAHPQHRMAVYLGGHRALTRTVYGHKMYVDTRDVGIAPHLLLDGFWERDVTDVFRKIVQPAMTVVEIGANVGYYTVIAADRIGPDGRLFAFEANPSTAAICRHNVEINGFRDRTVIVDKAVLAQGGTRKFGVLRDHAGSSSFYATAEYAAELHDGLSEIEVEAVGLDEYFARGQTVDALKIDAEGAEVEILRGARRLLADNPGVVVLLEYAPSILMRACGAVTPFWDEVRALGFNVFEVRPHGALVQSRLEGPLTHCDLVLRR